MMSVDELMIAYRLGVAEGREQAAAEELQAWAVLRTRVRAIASQATTAEHAEMDRKAVAGVPCPTKCDRCSRCIRAAAVARRGGDYTGGPVRWETA